MLPWFQRAIAEFEQHAPEAHQVGCASLQDADYAAGTRRRPRGEGCDCLVPTYMKARVKADKMSMYMHGPNADGDCPACGFTMPCPTLRAIASSYRYVIDGWLDEWSLSP